MGGTGGGGDKKLCDYRILWTWQVIYVYIFYLDSKSVHTVIFCRVVRLSLSVSVSSISLNGLLLLIQTVKNFCKKLKYCFQNKWYMYL